MTLFHFVFSICLVWIIVSSLNHFLKIFRRTKNAYLSFLEDYGLSVSFGYCKCYTWKLNNFFSRVDKWPRNVLHVWFTVGTYVGIATMFASVVVLLVNLLGYFRSASSEDHVLVPVVPGVNLPWGQVFFYMVVLLILAVLHEAGHAIAAVSEQVRLNGFAVFMFLVYPGAYVDLQSDHLKLISAKRQLKIYCAGSWHNVVIALVALLLLNYQHLLLCLCYSTGNGVSVTSVAEGSVMTGKLLIGTQITGVNSCPVRNSLDWIHCINQVIKEPQHGYCTSVYMLALKQDISHSQTRMIDGVRDCCDPELSSTHVCFYIVQLPTLKPVDSGKPLVEQETDKMSDELSSEVVKSGTLGSDVSAVSTTLSTDDSIALEKQHVYKCLAARPITASAKCHSPRDCMGIPKQTCVFPTVDNLTKLVRVQHSHDVDALFFGDPRILAMTIAVSDYEPRTSLFWLQFPGILERFLVYCTSLSGALALLNMLPTFALDGQWTFMAFVEAFLGSYVESPKAKARLFNTVFTLCSFLLILNIIAALYTVL